jgi:hypothetical protein
VRPVRTKAIGKFPIAKSPAGISNRDLHHLCGFSASRRVRDILASPIGHGLRCSSRGRMSALRQKRPLTQSPYFCGQTIKDKRPRGHYTAWPLRDSPPRPSRDSVSGRIVCGSGCLSRV